MMPRTLTWVRHGESEGNWARTLAEAGQAHAREADLMSVHTCERRLTEKGVEQAKRAGAWLRKHWDGNTASPEDRQFIVSPYVRAIETAGHLGLDGRWIQDTRVVERNWGTIDSHTYEQRIALFGEQLEDRKSEAFFWRPADGETLQDVFNRIRAFLDTMRRKCTNKHVLVVCHGETMWAVRYLLEYWTPQKLADEMQTRNNQTRLINCRIVQYVRDNDDEFGPKFDRVRFIDPSNPDDPERNRDWKRITRPTYSSEELIDMAESRQRFLV
ncbi:MAG TPA: histidine phosphatase family protein [Candidatus Paceibacterota bacterium]|nr:histidine phosphatase family protein [Candidatus Paceibacterota bacterium]